MLERENGELVRGTRVVSHWTGEDGNPVPWPPAEAAGVVCLGVEVIVLGDDHGMLRTFGFLPEGCELPTGWYVVRGDRDLETWHDHFADYLEGQEQEECSDD
jgi:hypothetical protein